MSEDTKVETEENAWTAHVRKYREENPEVSYKNALRLARETYHPPEKKARKRKCAEKSDASCVDASSDPPSDGAKEATPKLKGVEKMVRHKKFLKFLVEDFLAKETSHREFGAMLKDAIHTYKETHDSTSKGPNPWMEHVMGYRKANPGKDFSVVLQEARLTYTPVEKTPVEKKQSE